MFQIIPYQKKFGEKACKSKGITLFIQITLIQ